MPTTYYGNVLNPSRGASAAPFMAILATSNTTPIGVTTVAAHGLSTGDCVEIAGAQDPNANGVRQIAVTSPTAFNLVGAVGTLSGGQAGNVSSCTVDPAIVLPNAGEAFSAANVGLVGEAGADLAPYLLHKSGRYRLADHYALTNNTYSSIVTPWTNWGGSLGTTPLASVNLWQQIAPPIFGGTFVGYTNPPGLRPGDIMDISLTFDVMAFFQHAYPAGPSTGAASWAFLVGIGVAVDGGAPSPVFGSEACIIPVNPYPTPGDIEYIADIYQPGLVMHCTYSLPPIDHSSFDIAPFAVGRQLTGAALSGIVTVAPCGIMRCAINHYRLN